MTMSDAITLSGVTLDCPDARRLADFYAAVPGGTVSLADGSWPPERGRPPLQVTTPAPT